MLDVVGWITFVMGIVLVFGAFYRLGITGTYLGDYMGILMDERVTAFPFNVLNNPMYVGSTLIFLAWSILQRSPVGFVLTAWVALVYYVATIYFEEYVVCEGATAGVDIVLL